MQAVAYLVPLFFVVFLGGGYVFKQVTQPNPNAVEVEAVQPVVEKNPSPTPLVPTPEPEVKKKPVVSVPTSQPVTKPVEKKKKKGGTKKHNDDSFYFDSYVPTYIPSAIPKSTSSNYKTNTTVDTQKKSLACHATARQCMSDIGIKIIGLSGSAYSAAAKAYGDVCNKQLKSCLK